MHSSLQPRVRWLINQMTGDMVLDIGFLGSKGEPLIHRAIRDSTSARVIGFDIASAVLVCREPDSLIGNVHFLPFRSGSFDTVILGEFVEHFQSLSLRY